MQINITKSVPTSPTSKPPTTPDTEPAAAPEPALTPEQIQARAKESFAAMGWPEEDVAPPPTVDPTKVPGSDTPAEPSAEPPATPPAVPAMPAVPAEPESESETTEDIIRRTAAETAEAIRRQEPPVPEPAPAPAFEMSEDDADDYRALQFLESEDPHKYAGKAAQWLAYVKAHYAYQDKWESENPGKEYNQADDEHAEFFTNNPIDVPDKKILTKALVRLQVKEGLEESLRPQREREKASQAWENALPNIAKQVDTSVSKMVTAFDPEIAKLVTGADGRPNPSDENLAKLAQTDPIAAAILGSASKAIQPLLVTLEKTIIPELQFKLDRTVPAHALVIKYTKDAEDKMASAPADIRNQNGKTWKPVSEVQQMRESIMRSAHTAAEKQRQIEALDQRYWVLTIDNVAEVIVDDYGKKAKKLFDEYDGLAAKKYKPKETPAPAESQPSTPSSAPAAPSNGGRPRPPSLSSAADVVATPQSGTAKQKTAAEQAADVMFK